MLFIVFLAKTTMRKVNSEPQSGREAILTLNFTQLINPYYLKESIFIFHVELTVDRIRKDFIHNVLSM